MNPRPKPLHPGAVSIDDPADERVEVFLGLRDAVLRQRREGPGGDMEGVFIAEGDVVIERALDAGYQLLALLYDEARTTPFPESLLAATSPNDASVLVSSDADAPVLVSSDADAPVLVSSDADASMPISSDADASMPISSDADASMPISSDADASMPIIAAGPTLLGEISGFGSYRGAMACFARQPLASIGEVLDAEDCRTVLVTEGVTNPTNMGVLIRSAAALGIDAVLSDPHSCDVFSRRCCRVSMGAVFGFPAARIGEFPEALSELSTRGFHTAALTPAADAVDIASLDYGPNDKVALIVGAEGPGLTESTLHAADVRVQIPMARAVDSLNVGAAAAVAFYALSRRLAP